MAESDQFVSEVVEVLHSRPWIKFCDLRTVLVDPGCHVGDIRKAKWVIYRDYAHSRTWTNFEMWGYCEYKEKRKTYSRKQKAGQFVGATGEVEPIHTAESDQFVSEVWCEVLHSRPWIKFCDLQNCAGRSRLPYRRYP